MFILCWILWHVSHLFSFSSIKLSWGENRQPLFKSHTLPCKGQGSSPYQNFLMRLRLKLINFIIPIPCRNRAGASSFCSSGNLQPFLLLDSCQTTTSAPVPNTNRGTVDLTLPAKIVGRDFTFLLDVAYENPCKTQWGAPIHICTLTISFQNVMVWTEYVKLYLDMLEMWREKAHSHAKTKYAVYNVVCSYFKCSLK